MKNKFSDGSVDLAEYKKAIRPTEHIEQTMVIQWRDSMLWACPDLAWLHAIPNGAKLPYTKAVNGRKTHSRQGQILKAEGMQSGVPDLSLPVPRGVKHGAYVEMKREKGDDPTPEQKRWLDYLNAAGYDARCCKGAVEAIYFFANYLGLEVDPQFFNGYEPDYE